ncbi:hypothetical protein E2C01_078064 [Portunus trituberculatus]|uniref:Uncharacterized protein n=1 Tax=Portunus trituberculatus TaxID=210409 RepID=A0A5B7ILW4_PORTR|nr:hypothetical protein [Portunus trituberculatus]
MLGDSTCSSPPGYRAFLNTPFPYQGHHGGTAILDHQDIPVVALQLNSPLQVVAVKVFMGRSYTVCSLYLPPRRFRQFLGCPKRPVPWWSAACTKAVQEKRAAFSGLRRHRGDPQCLEAFRRCRARDHRVLKEAKRAS